MLILGGCEFLMSGSPLLIAQEEKISMDPSRPHRHGKGSRTFIWKPRPESDRDCFICVTFARQQDGTGEVPRREKMLYSETDPGSYITEYILVDEDSFAQEEKISMDPSRPHLHGKRNSLLPLRCRGTSLIRNRHPVGSCSRTVPRLLWLSYGGGRFFMSEVPL